MGMTATSSRAPPPGESGAGIERRREKQLARDHQGGESSAPRAPDHRHQGEERQRLEVRDVEQVERAVDAAWSRRRRARPMGAWASKARRTRRAATRAFAPGRRDAPRTGAAPPAAPRRIPTPRRVDVPRSPRPRGHHRAAGDRRAGCVARRKPTASPATAKRRALTGPARAHARTPARWPRRPPRRIGEHVRGVVAQRRARGRRGPPRPAPMISARASDLACRLRHLAREQPGGHDQRRRQQRARRASARPRGSRARAAAR